MTGMGRPTTEPDGFKGRSNTFVGIAEAISVSLYQPLQSRAFEETAAALDQRVCCSHGAQIMHERNRGGIADGHAVDISYRQSETGALKQSTRLAHAQERNHSRRGPSSRLNLRRSKALSQLSQGISTCEGGKQQSIRFQSTADLDERAGKIVDELQGEDGNDQIERALAKGQHLLVGDDSITTFDGPIGMRLAWAGGKYSVDLPAADKLASDRIARSAEIKRAVEPPQERCEPLRQFLRSALQEKRGRSELCRTLTVHSQLRLVKNQRGGCRRHICLATPFVAYGTRANRYASYLGPETDIVAMQAKIESDAAPARRLPRVSRAVGAIFDLLARVALPQLCPSCREPVEGAGLCASCWSKLSFIAPPYCERLGIPFAFEAGPGLLSMEAISDPPAYGRARAAVRYDDVARSLVHGFKYGDRLDLAPIMGRWMANAGRALLADADALVPVPLHWRRQWWRRFNQSALLAEVIAKEGNRTVAHKALNRVKATPQQVGLDKSARAQNVQGAFRVLPEGRAEVAGRKLVLVDDVLTSGATLDACARALFRGGAASVDVLVFARVVTSGRNTI